MAAMWVAATLFLLSSLCSFGGERGFSFVTGNDDADTARVDTTAADTLDCGGEGLWPLNVQSRLDALLQADIFETSTVGLMVYDLTADSAIYRYNEKQLMRPASTLKMMVAVAALDRLGKDYEYATTLYYTGTVEGGVLDGDLYCRGGFDPAFTSADLDVFVDSIRSLGIDTIRGHLYADVSMKDDDRLGEGWCWDDDNPVLSPLLVHRKDEFSERLLDRLHRAGVVVEGELRTGRTPHDAAEVCTIRRSVNDILPRMMKKSDNLYAESLFYQLAASSGSSHPATAKQGRRMMNRLIESSATSRRIIT